MIFQPLNLAVKPVYASPSTIENASLIAIGNATRTNKYVHIMKPDWTGDTNRDNARIAGNGAITVPAVASPHMAYQLGDSPHRDINVAAIMTLPPNSLVKVKKDPNSMIYISGGILGLYVGNEPDQFTSVTKIGYAD